MGRERQRGRQEQMRRAWEREGWMWNVECGRLDDLMIESAASEAAWRAILPAPNHLYAYDAISAFPAALAAGAACFQAKEASASAHVPKLWFPVKLQVQRNRSSSRQEQHQKSAAMPHAADPIK